jgi:hypothetical protein
VEYKVQLVDSSRVVRSTEWLASDQLRTLHEMIDLFENENCRRSAKQRA